MTAPEIDQEIGQTRERLGGTADEMAARADVKARAAGMKARAAEMSGRVRRSGTMRRRWPLAAAGVLVAGSAIIWRRRRSR